MNHLLVKFGGHKPCGNKDVTDLRVETEGSSNIIGRNDSRLVTLPSLVAIRTVVVKIK